MQGPRRLEERLREERKTAFVGRAAEITAFSRALAGEPDAGVLFYLQGPGGIGKSALLRRFADAGHLAGRTVVEVDGKTAAAGPAAFETDAVKALVSENPLLIVDGFEHCQGLDRWLRERFLPRLPERAVIAVAGRHPLDPLWRSDSGWAALVRVMPISELPHEDAAALLGIRGVPAEQHAPLLDYAGGHPLALSLAAEVTQREGTWQPTQDVTSTLLKQLVEEIPSAAHRAALQVCAHARITTEELLRVSIPDEDPEPLFEWLRNRPYIDEVRGGVQPHDVVRDALDDDLRWRNPKGYQAMHLRMLGHLAQEARASSPSSLLRAVDAVNYLHRRGGVKSRYYSFAGQGAVSETALQAQDRPVLIKMTDQVEGAAAARLVEYWLDQQPEAFHIHRHTDTGNPVGFMTWLRLDASHERQFAADPVVAAAWSHSNTVAPLRTGEHIAVARFVLDPLTYQRPSTIMDLALQRMVGEYLTQHRLAWSYSFWADPNFWGTLMQFSQQHPATTIDLPGARGTLYAHDWRAQPLVAWLDSVGAEELFGRRSISDSPVAPAEFAVLSREQFDAAVRDALRAWRRPELLSANPLLRSQVVAGRDAGPADVLSGLLAEAAEDLGRDPRRTPLQAVLTTTYFDDVPTQEAAAARLDLPMTTYRRYLTRATEHVVDHLWQRELTASEVAAPLTPPSKLRGHR